MAFAPPLHLRNPHLQSVLASAGPRSHLERARFAPLIAASSPVVLPAAGGARLLGHYAEKKGADALVTLIHGWEGSSGSTYILSAAAHLHRAGFSVLRLNLRDHGPSHHLNGELFHSARTDEVAESIRAAQDLHPHEHNHLAGFSLGGNFALRVALRAGGDGPRLTSAAAVCPVLDPGRTMALMRKRHPFYSAYFRRKWKRSLRTKQALHPNLDLSEVLALPDLDSMTDHLVAGHTPYADAAEYYRQYTLTDGRLAALSIPTRIIQSQDDPLIPADELANLPHCDHLTVELTDFGGHCGFIDSLTGPSWVDRRLVELFSQSRPS